MISTLACLLAVQNGAPVPPEIENEQIQGINKIPYHSILMPYASLNEAMRGDRNRSSYARSLNGTWKFAWVKRPEERQADFYRTDFDDSKWKTIDVPSNVEVKGYGTPYYRNAGYIFQPDPPRVMSEPPKNYTNYVERNPVSSYRRTFDVPAAWAKRQTFITFYGVDAGFFVWVNGKRVGFSTNSRNPAEFDLTPYIHTGKNSIAVEVYRFTTGSYFEDQDMYRLSGIFRDVTLWSAPKVHIQDTFVKPDLDSSYRDGTLSVKAAVHNYGNKGEGGRPLRVSLYDPAGRLVTQKQVSVPSVSSGGETSVQVNLSVANPAKWTAETPNLYTAVLDLGNGQELISHRVGFRKVEIKGRVFMINGRPVKLKGANRHEMDPNTGHRVTEAQMLKDLEMLKKANCNHVRTCHYSDDPRWYELCDEWGIYLVAEANAECHGLYGRLDRDPRFEKMVVDRNVANVENFKNHASVVIWSLGNECGGGSNFVSALRKVEELDPSRPTHYEPFGDGARNPAGIDSHMYTDIPGVERIANDPNLTKPFYMCEYAHAMNNSMGSIDEYNDLFDKYPALMGGAVWEWEDQGLWNRRDPKRPKLAYGGGFGEFPNDGFFIHKGVVFSDRSPKPHFPEMKRAYQWVSFSQPGDGAVHLKNRFAFANLNRYDLKWTVVGDRGPLATGTMALPSIAPGQEQAIKFPLPLVNHLGRADALYLNWAVTLRQPERWARKGFEIANGQFAAPDREAGSVNLPTGALSARREADGTLLVSGQNFGVTFNPTTGTIGQWTSAGKSVLLPSGGPTLHLWRAQHRNDDGWAAGGWRNAGLKNLKPEVLSLEYAKTPEGNIEVSSSVRYVGSANFRALHLARYTIYPDGRMAVDNAVSPSGPNITLARVGVRMLLNPAMEDLSYFARGPMENYADRKRGSDLGRYTSTVTQQLTPYEKPQEAGNHEDLRWLNVGGKGLPTLHVSANGAPLQFSALPYRDEDMDDVMYRVDLPKRDATVVIVSGKTLGVGSAACGPRPQPPYRLDCTPMQFSYVMRLGAPSEKPLDVPGRAGSLPLVTKTPDGHVSLGDLPGLMISDDGTNFVPYTAPLTVEKSKVISVKGPFVGKVAIEAVAVKSGWSLRASSFEQGEGNPENAIDNDATTFWHSRWSGGGASGPHVLTLDMRKPTSLRGLNLLPRQDDNNNGRVKDLDVFVSDDGTTWGPAIFHGTLRNTADRQTVWLNRDRPLTTRFVRLVIQSDWSGAGFGSLADLDIEP